MTPGAIWAVSEGEDDRDADHVAELLEGVSDLQQGTGLSLTQKKQRCAQYELAWVSGFKKLGSMSKAVRDETTRLLGPGGEFNAMKAGIVKYHPTALGRFT